MNWDAIGALGEVGGAIAVVATLAYLARQIREANRVMKAEAARARGERMVNMWFRVAESDRLFSAVGDAYFDEKPFEALSAEDRRALQMMLRGLTAVWESEYLENCLGVLDDQVWGRRLQAIAAMLEEKPSYYQAWLEIRSTLTEEFVAVVDNARARRKSNS